MYYAVDTISPKISMITLLKVIKPSVYSVNKCKILHSKCKHRWVS